MSTVTVHHAELDRAITEAGSLRTRLDNQVSNALSNAPIDLPSLSSHTVTRVGTWLDRQIPMLEGLSTIAKLLDTEGSGNASFDVVATPYAVRNMVGETLAAQANMVNPNFKEEFRNWAEEFSDWLDDPQVMSSFYTHLTPEGSLRLMSTIAGPDQVGRDDFVPFEERQLLLDQLRTGLETATTHVRFDNEGFARGLVEQATIDPEEIFGRGIYNPSGALAFLLRDGDFDRAFLETVATELDHYERVENNGAPGLWGRRPDQSADFGQFMPPGTAMTYDNLDPMASLMSAMKNDPEYALEFFGDTTGSDDVPARAEYYIKDRSWDQDGYQGITGVLDAATTHPDVTSDPTSPEARAAAMLASQTIEYFSERTNIDDLPDKLARWAAYGDNDSAKNLAHIMTTYMPAVDAALHPDLMGQDVEPGVFHQVPNGMGGQTLGNMPMFDRDSLDKFALLAMSSDDGFAEVRAGVTDYRERHLGAAVNAYASDTEGNRNQAILDDALHTDARREGYFVRLIGEQNISEGAAADARTQAWIDFGSEVVDLVPVPGVDKLEGLAKDVVSAAVDRAKGQGTDAITSSLLQAEDRARATTEDAVNATREQQSYAVASLLADRGLAGDATLDVPSWQEYQAMSDSEKRDLWIVLNSQNDGVGAHFSGSDYADAFNSEIDKYFYDK